MKKILLTLIAILAANTVHAQAVAKSFNLSSTPTIDTAAYLAGELIGGKISLANAVKPGAQSGVISAVLITDLDSDAADIDVVYFKSNPSATTFTDQAAFDIADADLVKIVCAVSVTDYLLFSDNAVGIAQNVNCPFDLGDGTTLYAALVSRGTPDYATASDLTLVTSIFPD